MHACNKSKEAGPLNMWSLLAADNNIKKFLNVKKLAFQARICQELIEKQENAHMLSFNCIYWNILNDDKFIDYLTVFGS